MEHLEQLCPTRGPRAVQSKVLCGPARVFAVVKLSYLLTICPYFFIFLFNDERQTGAWIYSSSRHVERTSSRRTEQLPKDR